MLEKLKNNLQKNLHGPQKSPEISQESIQACGFESRHSDENENHGNKPKTKVNGLNPWFFCVLNSHKCKAFYAFAKQILHQNLHEICTLLIPAHEGIKVVMRGPDGLRLVVGKSVPVHGLDGIVR